ncbi:MAG: hypothetical protein N2749_03120 [Clostridia bacterium]|nr:hypothetical protein [Clostridia bacterium]
MELRELEFEINKIKERNKRVELNKEWEGSILRKVLIAVFTYIVVIIFSIFVNKDGNIFLNCLVPVIVFILSTQSITIIKKLWIKNKSKKEVNV